MLRIKSQQLGNLDKAQNTVIPITCERSLWKVFLLCDCYVSVFSSYSGFQQ